MKAGMLLFFLLRVATTTNVSARRCRADVTLEADTTESAQDARLQGTPADPKMCREMCGFCGSHGSGKCVSLPWVDTANRSFFQCHACGFVFNPRANVNEGEMPEASHYLKSINVEGFEYQVGHALERWRCYARYRIAAIAKEGRKPRALEVGSALGFMMAVFRAQGWEVEGREMWTSWRNFASRYLQVPSSGEMVTGEGVPQYDLIYNNQVLEHVNEFMPLLSALYSRLLPGGMLWIGTTNANIASRPRTPNAKGKVLVTKESNPLTTPIFDNPLHVNHWSRESLRAAAESAGFAEVYTMVRGHDEWELVMYAMKPVKRRSTAV